MSEAPEPGVRVTLREVYAVVQSTHDLVITLAERADAQGATVADHETRLRTLERKVWAIPSAAVLTSIGCLIVSVIGLLHSYGH